MVFIRNAFPDELASLWEIRGKSARVGCANSYSAEQLDAWLSKPLPSKVAALIEAECVFVAERSESLAEAVRQTNLAEPVRTTRLVGYGALDPDTHEVEAVFVDPDASGTGVGIALLRAVETEALRRGIFQLRLTSTPNAEPFYRAAGYVPVRQIEHPLSAGLALPATVMEKLLRGSPSKVS